MNQLPLLSIEQSLNIYKKLHAKNPSFGMDIFDKNFSYDNFLILENNGEGNFSPYNRCESYTLILTLKGSSTRYINQHTYEIEEQTLQLLVPGVIQSFQDTSDVQNSYILVFKKEYLSSELESLLEFHKLHPTFSKLVGCSFEKVHQIFHLIDMEYKKKEDGYKEITKNYISQLLLLLKREKLSTIKTKPQTRAEQIITQYQNLIEEHYQTKKTVQEYADILKELQYLLVYTTLSIKQITTIMNFENSSDLGRFFKRLEGISPSKYRLTYKKP